MCLTPVLSSPVAYMEYPENEERRVQFQRQRPTGEYTAQHVWNSSDNIYTSILVLRLVFFCYSTENELSQRQWKLSFKYISIQQWRPE